MTLRNLLALLLLLVSPCAARAESDVWVLGDSIGEGVHLASGLPSQATHIGNVAIYTPRILEQIDRVPRGASVFISLGTNDAVADQVDVKDRVEKIVSAAKAQGLNQVWIGPPCVVPRWETHAKEIDETLSSELGSLKIPYVSTQDADLCPPAIHAGDGVHFTMAGYSFIWHKAAAAAREAGIEVQVASAVTSIAGPHVAHGKSWRYKHKHKNKQSTVKTPDAN